MTSKSHGNRSVPSVLKKENDWEVVSYDTAEQVAVSDPLNDPLNNVGLNSMINAEKNKSPESEPVIKLEILEQENSGHENSGHENSGHENSEQEISGQEINTASPYFMSEVTNDTATEGEATNHAEQSEAVEVVPVEVVPDCSWEARNESNNDDDNVIDIEEHDISEEYDNSTRENVFVDIDYNGIASSDSDSKDDGDNDYDSDVSFGKRKKPKKSPQKNINKKCKLTSSDNNEKCKLTSTESVPFGSNKIEILNNPESIYIPNGWTRRVFQRLTGKYPGKLDVFYIEPKGKKFRSKIDIIRYYSDHNLKLDIDVQAMCFGFGQPGGLPVIPDHLKRPNDALITKAPTKPRTPSSNISNNKKHYNKRKYEMEISAHNTAVSTLCERLSVENVTVEYSEEDFVNLTNHQVYTEYISAMLESENPEVPASAISEVAEAKWKQFLSIKESKTVPKDDKVSQEVLDFLNDDNHDEPDDDRDEDYKDDAADSNDSDYATNPQKVKKRVQCPCCMEKCDSYDAFGKHLKDHEEEQKYDIDDNPYSCPHCHEKFESIDNLFSHLESHEIFLNNKQPGSLYSCIYCVRVCSTLLNLKQHVNSHLNCRDEHGNVVMYMCPICQNRFTKVSVLRKHVTTLHRGSEEFYFKARASFDCPHCPMRCIRIQNLISHIKSKHTEEGNDKSIPDKYKCIQCDYTTNRKERLAIHIRVHTGEKPFKCHLCDHSTANISNLKLHMLVHNETKRYKCSVCDYRCNQRSSLKVHERMHTDDRPYLCSDCGHRCLTKNNLDKHMKNHVEGSEYGCSDCGMKFLHTNSLKAHMINVHSLEVNLSKQFQCPECNYRAATKGNLKVHMRVHTGERSFVCPECGKTFTQGGSLKIHMRKHTGEKPFGCRKCGYRCTTRGNLLKHMIKHGGYTSKDLIEENCDEIEEFSELNCKKILSDIMKIGSNLEVDQTVINEVQEEYEDVEIIKDTFEKESPGVHINEDDSQKIIDSNNEALSSNEKQISYESDQANYFEPHQSDYNNLHSIKNIINSNVESISTNDKYITYESDKANSFEPHESDFDNVQKTILSDNNEVIKPNEKRAEDEQHFLSQFF